MRCYCCNKILTTQEATRKFSSGEFTDMCNPCLNTIQDDVNTEDSLYDKEEDDSPDGRMET